MAQKGYRCEVEASHWKFSHGECAQILSTRYTCPRCGKEVLSNEVVRKGKGKLPYHRACNTRVQVDNTRCRGKLVPIE